MIDTKQTMLKTNFTKSLAEDEEYYKYVFKKTEKIVCAVFYTIRSTDSVEMSDILIKDCEYRAQRLMDIVHETLHTSLHDRDHKLAELESALRLVGSKLRLLVAARLLATELFEVFQRELEGVERSLKRYLRSALTNPLFTEAEPTPSAFLLRRDRRERRASSVTSAMSGSVTMTQGPSRRERILAVIKDKGEVTIKDVADIITDCSEKTIQRELIDMIKDGVISRKGERRWSRYSLVID